MNELDWLTENRPEPPEPDTAWARASLLAHIEAEAGDCAFAAPNRAERALVAAAADELAAATRARRPRARSPSGRRGRPRARRCSPPRSRGRRATSGRRPSRACTHPPPREAALVSRSPSGSRRSPRPRATRRSCVRKPPLPRREGATSTATTSTSTTAATTTARPSRSSRPPRSSPTTTTWWSRPRSPRARCRPPRRARGWSTRRGRARSPRGGQGGVRQRGRRDRPRRSPRPWACRCRPGERQAHRREPDLVRLHRRAAGRRGPRGRPRRRAPAAGDARQRDGQPGARDAEADRHRLSGRLHRDLLSSTPRPASR